MNETLYRFISWGFQDLIWGGDLLGEDRLPDRGPAVFVSNHLGSLGPIAAGASLPFFVHPWIHADMLDERLAPDYLRRDFVEPTLHILPPFSHWLARGISKLHVPLLRALGGIPVYHTPEGLSGTFRQTLNLLTQDRFILIFPEHADLPPDPQTKMRPFQKGFARLGELFYEKTHQVLAFYPLAVHAETRTLRVGNPIRYNYINNPASERQRIASMLEQSIHEMVLHASEGEIAQLPLPN